VLIENRENHFTGSSGFKLLSAFPEGSFSMYPPMAPRYLGVFGLFLIFLFVLIELQIIEVAYYKLDISRRAMTSLLLLSILGSYINIPIVAFPAEQLVQDQELIVNGIPYLVPHAVEGGRSVSAVNVGGALIPTLLSIHLLVHVGGWMGACFATAIVTVIVTIWRNRSREWASRYPGFCPASWPPFWQC
jgi:uncharacterized membrane protein